MTLFFRTVVWIACYTRLLALTLTISPTIENYAIYPLTRRCVLTASMYLIMVGAYVPASVYKYALIGGFKNIPLFLKVNWFVQWLKRIKSQETLQSSSPSNTSPIKILFRVLLRGATIYYFPKKEKS